MTSGILKYTTFFCAIVFSAHLQAQSMVQPGQIAAASQSRISSGLLASVSTGPMTAPAVEIATVPDHRSRTVNRVWLASLFAVTGASALDAASSWGKYERNPLLASSNGTFDSRGLVLKAGLAGAIVIPQLFLHKHQELKAKFAIFNFAGAGAFTAVAIHNLGVAAPKS